jgi:diguanylate cyclase (GGDEF)-like protein
LLSGPATAAGDPFASHFGVEEEPYCLTDAHGAPRAVRITAAPVLDGLGRWKGMRGVARDVTQSLVMRNRLTATDRILRAMSEDLEPGDLGAVAAEAIAQSCEAAAVWLFASGGECAGTYGAQACLSDMVLEIEGRLRRDQSDAPMVFSAGEVSGLGLALRSKKSVAGVLMIARGHGAAMFSPDSLALTRELTPLLVALLRGFGPQRPHAPDRRDALTGLANKAGYEALAPGWIAAARREGRSGCVLLIDCDHFKAINACLGHQAGDAFLAETAALLRREAGPGDLCFRLEGDVFAVLQQDADEAAAVARAEAIARGFRAVSRKLSLALSVTPSIGVAPVAPALTASAVLDRAREGLQAAKRAGRNRIGAARDGEGGVLLRHCPKA